MELLLECLHEVQDPTLYQMVAEEWGGERLYLFRPSPVACLSAGYLLPRLPYPHIELEYLDDQHIVLFTKGLSNGCVDHQQPRSGIRITLRDLRLCGHDDQCIAQLLSSSFSISHLVLDYGLSSIDPLLVLRCIGEAMATNTSVRSLELEGLFTLELRGLRRASPSEDSPGPALCEMLERNKTLETLRFRYCAIAPCVASIAEGLVHNTTLKELVLNDCDVTDTAAKSLADMLVNNTTLETLGISSSSFYGIYNGISAEGVGHLAEALKGNSTLRVLRLDERNVRRNLEPLAVALTVNTTLERLEIWEGRQNNVPRHLNEKLVSNGVLQQLLTIAIERTVSKFGGEETGRALMTILEEWRDLYNTDVSEDYDSDDSTDESEDYDSDDYSDESGCD